MRSNPIRRVRPLLGAAYHRTVLARQPRILINSYPKSGTNLVAALVTELPWIRNHRRGITLHHVPRTLVDEGERPQIADALRSLEEALPGEVFFAHLESERTVMDYIAQRGFRVLFIYRDPRDIAVSLLHWWNRDPKQTWAESDSWPFRYFRDLGSDADRLSFIIEGWPENPGARYPQSVDFPDIGTRLRAFLGWLDEPGCLPIRFEELIDPSVASEVTGSIARHLYPDAAEARVDRLATRMRAGADPAKSRTFRRGTAGGWRDEFEQRHVEAVKACAGDLLVELGYESNRDW